jgi:tRNA A37 threonylcarbamoyladenosine dehydratase
MATTSGVNRSTLVGFVVGSLTAVLVLTFLSKKRQRKSENRPSSRSKRGLPAELRDEQLSRHTLYFGEKGMMKLKSAKVVVVGLGGVGSHTAHMLARAGVSHLRLIDFDQVTLSSLNRHACATLEDVGSPKATCLRMYLEKICPDPQLLRIEDIVQMYTAKNGPQLLAGEKWDLILDCIDDTPTKAALLTYCLQNDTRVVSCMGAGGKSDVTRLHISDLRTATRDPLASKLRQTLKQTISNGDASYLDDMDRLAVVFSSEKPVVKLADFTEQQKADGVHKYGAVDGMRIRILPVLGTMPAVMGQAIAAFALCQLGEKPFSVRMCQLFDGEGGMLFCGPIVWISHLRFCFAETNRIQPVTGERIGRNVRHK